MHVMNIAREIRPRWHLDLERTLSFEILRPTDTFDVAMRSPVPIEMVDGEGLTEERSGCEVDAAVTVQCCGS